MASCSDMATDQRQAEFVAKWVPTDEWEPLRADLGANARWYLARARAAESEVANARAILREFKNLLERI